MSHSESRTRFIVVTLGSIVVVGVAVLFASTFAISFLIRSIEVFLDGCASLADAMGFDYGVGLGGGVGIVLTTAQVAFSLTVYWLVVARLARAASPTYPTPLARVAVALTITAVISLAAAVIVGSWFDQIEEGPVEIVAGVFELLTDHWPTDPDELFAWCVVITLPATTVAIVVAAYAEYRWRCTRERRGLAGEVADAE